MRVLLDHNVNPRFAKELPEHDVSHTHQMGWEELRNGELIRTAEAEGFDAMITADKQMRYQQNLAGRSLSILVLNSLRITLPHIEKLAPQVNMALSDLRPGSFLVLSPEEPG